MWLGLCGADTNKRCTGCLMASSPVTISPQEPQWAELHVRRCYSRKRGRSLFSLWLALSVVSETDGDKERHLIYQLVLFNYLVHLLMVTCKEMQRILQRVPWKTVGRAHSHSLIAIITAVLSAPALGKTRKMKIRQNKRLQKERDPRSICFTICRGCSTTRAIHGNVGDSARALSVLP